MHSTFQRTLHACVAGFLLAAVCAIAQPLDRVGSPAFTPEQATAIVTHAYRDMLGRDPDPSGLESYAAHLLTGGRDEAWVRRTLAASDEGLRYAEYRRKIMAMRAVWTGAALLIFVGAAIVLTRRRLWKKTAFALLLAAAVAGLLELALRCVPGAGRDSPLRRSDRSRIFYEVDAERMHPWSRNTPDARRIAIVGDSFARGVGVQVHDRFAAKLEQMLNANSLAAPVTVDLFDAPGTSTFQQIPLLLQALERAPEIVILSVCLNDTEDWRRSHELEVWRAKMVPSPPPRALAPLVRTSRLAEGLYRGIESIRARRGYHAYYHNLYAPEYSGWQRFAAAVIEMKDRCADAGVRFVVLVHPLLSEPFERGRYPFEFAHEAIGAHLERENIQGIDLLERFRNVLPVRMTAIPLIDPHPSEIAHRMAAEELLDFLVSQGLLGPEYALRWRLGELSLPERWRQADAGLRGEGR